MSNEDFLNNFCKRNIAMTHNKNFIIHWKKFLTNLKNDPKKKIICSSKPDNICENCDIKDKCLDKKNKLHKISKRLDKKTKSKYRMSKGDIFTVCKFL